MVQDPSRCSLSWVILPLLPVHFSFAGWGTSFRSWHEQLNFFGRRKEFTCCYLENRGVGRSDTPAGFYTYEHAKKITMLVICTYNIRTKRMAHDAAEVLDYLGWETFHLVGISMGNRFLIKPILIDRWDDFTRTCVVDGSKIGVALTPRHSRWWSQEHSCCNVNFGLFLSHFQSDTVTKTFLRVKLGHKNAEEQVAFLIPVCSSSAQILVYPSSAIPENIWREKRTNHISKSILLLTHPR